MRLAEGDTLDDALELFHNHAWVENKPVISVEQMAELIPVLAPLWQQSRQKVRGERPKQKVQNRPARKLPSRPVRASSSDIPQAIRDAVLERDGYCCVRCGQNLFGTVRYGLQHRRPRGAGGSRLLHTMANLVTLCGWTTDPGTCTAWVELEDRTRATAEGWLLPKRYARITPEEWPVLRWTPSGPEWQQPGDAWVTVEPHPRQLELGGAA